MKFSADQTVPYRIIDVQCGSGAIGLLLAEYARTAHLHELELFMMDSRSEVKPLVESNIAINAATIHPQRVVTAHPADEDILSRLELADRVAKAELGWPHFAGADVIIASPPVVDATHSREEILKSDLEYYRQVKHLAERILRSETNLPKSKRIAIRAARWESVPHVLLLARDEATALAVKKLFEGRYQTLYAQRVKTQNWRSEVQTQHEDSRGIWAVEAREHRGNDFFNRIDRRGELWRDPAKYEKYLDELREKYGPERVASEGWLARPRSVI